MRQTAISVLRGISIRMPLLIYGADVDVDEEISLEKFVEMVDETSWQEFMPRGITKEKFKEFTKYYDEDVFIAAGKRIRNLVKNADNLEVTERVRKIAEIFSYFRNPDKETVLTPWRVVNMHLGDCLGGYSFFDADYENPLAENEEPHFVQIDGDLPDGSQVTEKTLGNADAKILEINSKTGLYPLYCAYSIFRAKKELHSERNEKSLWNETISENIFEICKTPMAKAITQRTLSGYGGVKINAHYFEDLVNQLKNKSDNFISKVTGKSYWGKGDGKMDFDAIVGNPPYQEMDGGAGASATPVYNYFVENAIKLNPHFFSLIMPARWYAGGKGLDKFRDEMLQEKRIVELYDFANSENVFPGVNIAGGLCYFLWQKDFSGECKVNNVIGKEIVSSKMRSLAQFDVFVRNNIALDIIEKIKSYSYFAIRSYERGSQAKKAEDDVVLLSSKGKGYFPLKKVIDKENILPFYKTIITYAMSGGNKPTSEGNYQIISSLQILNPNEVCTETYLVLGAFDNKIEAENLSKYVKTKFLRFLLLQSLTSIHITRDSFAFVPLQDFTSASDIDWSKSVSQIDVQLYQKYNLSNDETVFIEKMIRPME